MNDKNMATVGKGETPPISVVVIGRNEGERLTRCLGSVRTADYPAEQIELIYVDTESTDNSCQKADELGAKVIRITPEHRTAAAARNAGMSVASHDLIHFLDGDTILDRAWLTKAVAAMNEPGVAAVYGRRDEIDPRATVYNFWMHHDWYVSPGRVESCGGDVLFRRDLLTKVGGYDATLIAGEERDLCFRLIRDHKIIIIRLDEPMTLHDIEMTRFGQYWKRCVRSGYAYAQVASRYPGLRACRQTLLRNTVHAVALSTAIVLTLVIWSPWPIAVWAALLGLAIARDALRCKWRVGSTGGALLYAFHHYLSKIPTVVGHLDYYIRQAWGAQPKKLIEYRGDSQESNARGQTTVDLNDDGLGG